MRHRFVLPSCALAVLFAVEVACGGSTSGVGQSDGSSGGPGTGDGSAPDASVTDRTDARADNDGVTSVDAGDIFTALPGIWLVGWLGDLNHYSWVRFDKGGQAEYLSGSDLPGNAPYWNCAGTGTWTPAQKPNTIFLTFPASCALIGKALTFDSFYTPTGFPKNASLGARISENPPNMALDGFKFPASQCNVAMTSCTNPL